MVATCRGRAAAVFVLAIFRLVLPLAFQAMFAVVAASAEQVKESHPMLGSLLEITIDSTDAETGHNRIRDAVTVAHKLESELTPGDESNDLMRLNARAGLGPLVVPLDLYRLLALSRLMTRSTGDAFDVTVGPLLRRRQPTAGERGARLDVDKALSLVDADSIRLHPPDQAELTKEGMVVDFSAIVRGYVLERMASSLRAGGVETALLELSDTVLAIGPPPGQPPFRVFVARGRSMVGSVTLRDRSVSTARARQRGDDSGRAPIVDPRSGRFVEGDRQATVVARDAAIADAWSTALVVDPDGSLGLLSEPRDVEALVFDEHGEHRTPRFDQFSGWAPASRGDAARGAARRGEATPDAAGLP